MNNERFENVSTKVATEVKEQLNRILKSMGLNEYQWLQLMIEVTIRMMDDRHNLSAAMAKMIQMFAMVPGFKDAASLVDANAEGKIDAAVYFVNVKGKKGYKPVMVERTWFDGQWNETHNVRQIVEYVIEKCAPDSYMKLRRHMQDLECSSVFECLMEMVDAYTITRLDEEIPQIFADNQRADNGKTLAYGERTKRKKSYSPDTMPSFNFDEGKEADDTHYIDDPLDVVNIHPDFDGMGIEPEHIKEGGDNDTR